MSSPLKQALYALAAQNRLRIKQTPQGLFVILPKREGEDCSRVAGLLDEKGDWTGWFRQGKEDRWIENDTFSGSGYFSLCKFLGIELTELGSVM